MIKDEMSAADPKPKSFWGEIIKGLAMAAINIVTGGVGGAIAGALTRGSTEVIQGLVGEITSNVLQSAGSLVYDGATAEGEPGSPETGKAPGGEISTDAKAAYFSLQEDALSQLETNVTKKFKQHAEPLTVHASFHPVEATEAMVKMEQAVQAQIEPSVQMQRAQTAAKWSTYLVQSQLGTITGEEEGLDEAGDLARSGYRGTNMTVAAAGRELKTVGRDYLDYNAVKGLLDIEIEGNADGSFKVVAAKLSGFNSKMRARIEAMVIKGAGFPLRIRGMVRHGDYRDPVIITRNERGALMVPGFSEHSKAWLALSGNGNHMEGATNIVESLIGGSVADLHVKLGG
jgi:hypothetical protein